MTNICTAINLSVVLELLFYTGYFPEQRLRRRGMQVNQELESGEKKEEEPGEEEEQLQPEHEDEVELGEEKKQLQPDREHEQQTKGNHNHREMQNSKSK
jgi:hypothetical protein